MLAALLNHAPLAGELNKAYQLGSLMSHWHSNNRSVRLARRLDGIVPPDWLRLGPARRERSQPVRGPPHDLPGPDIVFRHVTFVINVDIIEMLGDNRVAPLRLFPGQMTVMRQIGLSEMLLQGDPGAMLGSFRSLLGQRGDDKDRQ